MSSAPFQHIAAQRRLTFYPLSDGPSIQAVSTHSRLEAAESVQFMKLVFEPVSTHSRLEAAEPCAKGVSRRMNCFNTQPPRGG